LKSISSYSGIALVFRPELIFTVNLSSADFFVVIITTPFAAFDP
jgi:hypothetical protein